MKTQDDPPQVTADKIVSDRLEKVAAKLESISKEKDGSDEELEEELLSDPIDKPAESNETDNTASRDTVGERVDQIFGKRPLPSDLVKSGSSPPKIASSSAKVPAIVGTSFHKKDMIKERFKYKKNLLLAIVIYMIYHTFTRIDMICVRPYSTYMYFKLFEYCI